MMKKFAKKNEFEEGKYNNSMNKYYLKENFDADFDKYMVNDFTNENFDPNKKYEVLDLSADSSVRQSGIDKKQSKATLQQDDIKNKFNNFNDERKNSVSSNSIVSEVSIQSSKKSLKFEKNIEKIKNISSNLVEDDFLMKLLNKIDDNLNSDKVNNSSNNIFNTSQKTSNFEMLDKKYAKVKSNKEIKIGINEDKLNKSNLSVHSDNNPGIKGISNNLANNLTNVNASIYHSFGDTNQFVPTFKIIINKEANEEHNELIENNTIELVETLHNSKVLQQEEEKRTKFFSLFLEKLESNYKIYYNSYFKIFVSNTNELIQTLSNKARMYYIHTFFNKIKFDRQIKTKKTYIIERNNRLNIYKQRKEDVRKRNIFNEFTRMCRNQSEWVKKISYEFKKNDLWFIIYINIYRQLLDNWKIFVNYKKIKRYYKNKLKLKAFNLFKINLKTQKKLEERSIKLYYIFTMKYCLYNIRMNAKISRKYDTNRKLADEYKSDKLKKKIFKILKNYNENIILIRKKQLE